jgi:type III secretory pathway component EscS
MDQASVSELISQALTSLFLFIIPVVVASSVTGTIVAALQGAGSMYDSAINYAARLIAVSATVYFLFPAMARSVIRLAEAALR